MNAAAGADLASADEPMLDLVFALSGSRLPRDYGLSLWRASSTRSGGWPGSLR